MSYIGRYFTTDRTTRTKKLDDISSSFGGSNTTFSLTSSGVAVYPASARNLLISLNGVLQEPDAAYSVNGSSLIFSTAPLSGSSFFGVLNGEQVDIHNSFPSLIVNDGITANTLTANLVTIPTLRVANTSYPKLIYDYSGGSADQKKWQSYVHPTGGVLTFAPITDTESAEQAQISFDRSGGIRERSRTVAMGEWTSVAYSASNFVPSTGTWTVDSGDAVLFRYMQLGKTLIVAFAVSDSSVTGSPGDLRIVLPGSLTAAATYYTSIRIKDNGTWAAGYAVSFSTYILCRKIDDTSWATSTNNTSVFGQIMLEVG